MLRSIKLFLLSAPPEIIFWRLKCRVFKTKIKDLTQWQQILRRKGGIEIGGPSPIFSINGFLPLYNVIDSLDGVNFGTDTIWEGTLKEGSNFYFGIRKGYQYIAEGSDLPQIESGKYEFVLSCNNLEHIANPLKTLFEWKRIVKEDGIILLVLPRKESNFDHRRPTTKLEHLIEDYNEKTGEMDLTHLEEILSLHDLKRDRLAGNNKQFEKRGRDNINNRCLHHHVFDQVLLKQMLEYAGLEVIKNYSSKTDHYIAGRKT